MRTAVLIRGELREWDLAKLSILRNFTNCDFFFSTWTTNQRIYAREKDYYFGPVEQVSESHIRDDMKHANLVDISLHRYDELAVPENHIKITTYMHYLWEKCNDLKVQHEIKNNFVYDYVVSIRPDQVFYWHGGIPKEIVNVDPDPFHIEADQQIQVNTEMYDLYSPDNFYGLSSQLANVMFNFYSFIIREPKRYAFDNDTHCVFARYLLDRHILVKHPSEHGTLTHLTTRILRSGSGFSNEFVYDSSFALMKATEKHSEYWWERTAGKLKYD